MTILHYVMGDVKLIVNELEIDELTSETRGEIVLKHIRNSYAEFEELKLPNARENALYSQNGHRKRDEQFLQYCSSISAVLLQYSHSIHPVCLWYSCIVPTVLLQYSHSIPVAFLQYSSSITGVFLQYS